jgi:hypothetical protein
VQWPRPLHAVGVCDNVQGCTVYHLHTDGPLAYVEPDCEGIFRTKSMFIGPNIRQVNYPKNHYWTKILASAPVRIGTVVVC